MKGIEVQRNIGFIGCKSPTDILLANIQVLLEDESYGDFPCGHKHPVWCINGPISARFIRESDVVRKIEQGKPNGNGSA